MTDTNPTRPEHRLIDAVEGLDVQLPAPVWELLELAGAELAGATATVRRLLDVQAVAEAYLDGCPAEAQARQACGADALPPGAARPRRPHRRGQPRRPAVQPRRRPASWINWPTACLGRYPLAPARDQTGAMFAAHVPS